MKEYEFDGIILREMKRTEFAAMECFVNRVLESTFMEPSICLANDCKDITKEEDGECKLKEEDFFGGDGVAYNILKGDGLIGGAFLVFKPEEKKGELVLWGIEPSWQGQGMGRRVWQELERIHSDVETWELFTPVAAVKNIDFYINKCGFHAVEFVKEARTYPGDMLRFEKRKRWPEREEEKNLV